MGKTCLRSLFATHPSSGIRADIARCRRGAQYLTRSYKVAARGADGSAVMSQFRSPDEMLCPL
jgi:hypothetical protein